MHQKNLVLISSLYSKKKSTNMAMEFPTKKKYGKGVIAYSIQITDQYLSFS